MHGGPELKNNAYAHGCWQEIMGLVGAKKKALEGVSEIFHSAPLRISNGIAATKIVKYLSE